MPSDDMITWRPSPWSRRDLERLYNILGIDPALTKDEQAQGRVFRLPPAQWRHDMSDNNNLSTAIQPKRTPIEGEPPPSAPAITPVAPLPTLKLTEEEKLGRLATWLEERTAPYRPKVDNRPVTEDMQRRIATIAKVLGDLEGMNDRLIIGISKITAAILDVPETMLAHGDILLMNHHILVTPLRDTCSHGFALGKALLVRDYNREIATVITSDGKSPSQHVSIRGGATRHATKAEIDAFVREGDFEAICQVLGITIV